jgi:hypothetical protein
MVRRWGGWIELGRAINGFSNDKIEMYSILKRDLDRLFSVK